MAKNVDVSIHFLTKGKDAVLNSMKSITGSIGHMAKVGAVQLGNFFKDSIQLGQDFEMAITQVGVTAGATEEEFNQLSEAAKKAGETTMFTAVESADALNNLASAGFGVKGSIDLLQPTLKLAVGGNLSLEKSSKVVTAALKGFGVESENAEGLLDKLLKTTQVSSIKMGDLTAVLGNMSAKVVVFQGHIEGFIGTSLAMAGALKDSGISASKAGTDVARLVERFGAAGEKESVIASLFEGDAKALFDTEGKMLDVLDIVDKFQEKFKGFKNEGLLFKDLNSTFENLMPRFNELLPDTQSALDAITQLYAAHPDQLKKIMETFNKTSKDSQKDFLIETLNKSQQSLNALGRLGTEGAVSFIGNLIKDNEEMSERFFNSLGKFTDADTWNIMKDLLGTKGLSTFFTLVNQGTDNIRANAKKINEASGELAAAEKKFNDTLKGQVALFQSAWQGFQLRTSDQLQSTIKNTIGGVRNLLFGGEEVQIPVDLGLDEADKFISQKLNEGFQKVDGKLVKKGLLDLIDLEAIGNAFKGLMDSALSMANKLVPIITDIFDKFKTGDFGGIVTIIMDMVIKGLNKMAERIPAIINSIAEALPGIITSLATSLPKIATALTKILTTLLSSFIKVLPNIIEAILTELPKIIEAILTELPKIVEMLIGLLPDIVESLSALLPNLINTIISVLPQIINSIIQLLPTLINSIIGILPTLINAIVELLPGLIAGILALLPGLIENIIGLLPTLIQAIISLIPELIGGIIEVLPYLIQSLVELLPGIITGIIDLLPGLIESIISLLPTLIEAIVTLIPTLIDTIVNLIPIIINSIITMIPEIINSIVEAIPQIINSIVEAIPQIITSILDALPEIIMSIIEAIPDIILSIVEAIPQIITAINEKAPDIILAILKELPRIIKVLVFDLPKQIIDALIAQVPKLATALGKAISGVFSGISGFFDNLFGKSGPQKKANGGLITGPSSPLDSIPALLTGGEFVVNADSTRKFLPLLEQINTNGFPKFATGGKVELPNITPTNVTNMGSETQNKNVSLSIGNISINGVKSDINASELAAMIKKEIADELNLLIS
jgi:phage-related protein